MLNETMEQEPIQEDQADLLLLKTFSIIIPAYNEEKRIEPALNSAAEFISSNSLPWQIIVSIDGGDGTEDLVNKYSVEYPFIHAITSSGRGGKGGAIRRALPVNSDYTILMDADNSVSFQSIISALEFLKDYDIIILSRYRARENKIPMTRRFLSAGFNILSRVLIGVNVEDKQSGYKIFKTRVLLDSIKRVSVTNAFFDADLLYHARNNGAKVIEIPIKYDHKDGSTFRPLLLTMGIGVSLFAFAIAHSRFARFIPDRMKVFYYRKFKWI